MDLNKFKVMVRQVLFNELVITPMVLVLAYSLHIWLDRVPNLGALPSLVTIVRDLMVFAIVEDILFFYVHWLLHHR